MRNAILFTLIFFFSNMIWSQQTQLGFDDNGIQIRVDGATVFPPDSVVVMESQSLEYIVTFKNEGLNIFNGIVDLGIRPDTTGVFGDTLIGNGQSLSLMPGDTVVTTFLDSFDTNQNRYTPSGGGGVVVIVWPSVRAGNADSVDTVRISFISTPVSIDPEWEGKGLAVSYYPNPTKAMLHIDYGDLEREIGYVRFLDNTGRVCIHSQKAIKEIDMEGWPTGIYYLYVGGQENQQAVYRIVKN